MKKYLMFIIVVLMSINSFAGNLGDINFSEYKELEKIAKAARINLNNIQVAKNDNEFEKFILNPSFFIAVKIENKNITGLAINSHNIKSLYIIRNLVNLKTLILRTWYQISKIEGLDKLVNLNSLNLIGNQISKIEGLDKLVNLNSLNLSDNQNLSKIEGLDNLVNLNKLYLEATQISKIEGLDNLVNLNKLSLSGNQINKIEGLDNLVNLNKLYLEANQINKIEGLDNIIKRLPQLEKLDLYNNPLNEKSLEQIDQIQQKHPEIRFEY